jgi:hypothetical protein
MTGHGPIIGHRIRDRTGRFFGFGRDSYAAWEDAWRRIQEARNRYLALEPPWLERV